MTTYGHFEGDISCKTEPGPPEQKSGSSVLSSFLPSAACRTQHPSAPLFIFWWGGMYKKFFNTHRDSDPPMWCLWSERVHHWWSAPPPSTTTSTTTPEQPVTTGIAPPRSSRSPGYPPPPGAQTQCDVSACPTLRRSPPPPPPPNQPVTHLPPLRDTVSRPLLDHRSERFSFFFFWREGGLPANSHSFVCQRLVSLVRSHYWASGEGHGRSSHPLPIGAIRRAVRRSSLSPVVQPRPTGQQKLPPLPPAALHRAGPGPAWDRARW